METRFFVRPVAVSGLLGGLALAVTGLMQAVRPQDAEPKVTGEEHVILGLFAAALVLLAPLVWTLAGLGGRAARAGAALVVAGHALLAFGATASNLNGEDYAWFPAVAVPANLAVLAGSITLAVGLWRVPGLRPYAAALPLTWLCTIPLSQLGGPLLAGLYWLLALRLLALRAPTPAATH
ncbi:hypothetical protein LO762_04565 [Actinocorallia sp. API 0066]|uniref:hypothetical protein n=1 Tax=Actinocorallia sp. API 0066 TaxID=2896846 RepID=UPI001E324967|nr:hypothetical protein [Actinocorallia sp. API 0066]MCD0448470.1 hypothetical protein [Actinocorallia sp. API 0066]